MKRVDLSVSRVSEQTPLARQCTSFQTRFKKCNLCILIWRRMHYQMIKNRITSY